MATRWPLQFQESTGYSLHPFPCNRDAGSEKEPSALELPSLAEGIVLSGYSRLSSYSSLVRTGSDDRPFLQQSLGKRGPDLVSLFAEGKQGGKRLKN